MRLSEAVTECAAQGYMLRLASDTADKTLSAEQLFYGLLMLSKCAEPPISNAGFRTEGDAVAAEVTAIIDDIDVAAEKLKAAMEAPNDTVVNADQYIEKAAEIADLDGKSEIDALSLLMAFKQEPTQAIKALYKSPPKPPPADDKGQDYMTASQYQKLINMAQYVQRELDILAESQHQPATLNQKKAVTKKWLAGFAIAVLATFVTPSLLILLLGFIIDPKAPFLIIGLIIDPQTPLAFGFKVLIVLLGAILLINCIRLLISIYSKGFGLFFFLLGSISLLFAGYWYINTVIEQNIMGRILLCAVSLYVVISQRSAFLKLEDNKDSLDTITGLIIWRYVTTKLALPLLVFAVFFIPGLTMITWIEKILYIAGYLYFWHTIYQAIQLKLTSAQQSDARKGYKIFKFLSDQFVMLFLPGLAFYLHWIFVWFPMQTGTIVLLSMYGSLWLITTIAQIKGIREDKI